MRNPEISTKSVSSQEVSIITALHNGERFIEQTASSILNQTEVGIEWIVIDDNSSDNGLAVIEQVLTEHPNGLVTTKVVRHCQTQGITPTYTEGVALASSPFFKILDHDDVLPTPDSLQKQVQVLKQNDSSGLVFSRTTFIGPDSQPFKDKSYPFKGDRVILDKKMLRADLLFDWKLPYIHGSFLVSTAAFREIYHDKKPQFDTLMLTDFLNSGYNIAYLDDPLFHYRIHAGNFSRTPQSIEDFYQQRRYITQQLLGGGPLVQNSAVMLWKTFQILAELKNRQLNSSKRQ